MKQLGLGSVYWKRNNQDLITYGMILEGGDSYVVIYTLTKGGMIHGSVTIPKHEVVTVSIPLKN